MSFWTPVNGAIVVAAVVIFLAGHAEFFFFAKKVRFSHLIRSIKKGGQQFEQITRLIIIIRWMGALITQRIRFEETLKYS